MLAVLLVLILASAVFATTVMNVPAGAPLPLGFERMTPLPFRSQVSHLSHGLERLLGGKQPASPTGKPLTVAFYTSWTDASTPSLRAHIDQIDWVAPTLLAIDPAGKMIVTEDAPLRRVVQAALHRPVVVPVLQNAFGGEWDGPATAALMHDPARRAQLVASLRGYLDKTGDGGIMFDFENLPPASLPDLVRLLGETRIAFAPQHRIVAVTMPIDNPVWSAKALTAVTDRVFLMAYDQHWQGGEPGPIAASAWFSEHLAATLRGLPPGKAVVALGNYGYDWHDGKADSLTVEEAWLHAHDSGTTPVFDRASGNAGFSFLDNGHRHDVWMMDAATSWNQMRALSQLGIRDVALWRLGSEDPGFWRSLATWRGGKGRPDLTKLEQRENVDVEGSGEILRVTALPRPGTRQVDFDARTNQITGVHYLSLPTPFVVQRTGARDKLISLTFDDGPDPAWTPKILAILERYHVPATFFIVGENGVANRGLLQRMTADGDEIGNHSYTHPNMAEETETGVKLELNATQRLIEAFTGRSSRLFRAPYFGDAEPTTADELGPAMIAQAQGYTVVGLHVDPDDWKRPGVDAIVQRTLDQVMNPAPDRSANIVLLHDGGGDRAQTVAALPRIIEGLEQAGYRIVPAATLAGLDRDAVMPRVTGIDLAAVRADVAAFTFIGMFITVLDWTFFFAIALGMIRSVSLAMLALRRRREAPAPRAGNGLTTMMPTVMPAVMPAVMPTVTVIIPAFNEERVIEQSIRQILASDYPAIEVIVADDGSRDRTSAIVAAAFSNDRRVRLLTLDNGGKAAALNRALTFATGSVIVALDADTQFEPETVSRLVRWFADERIGAVAGNAKVGNRVNLVTRWQAVE
ncbi:MAG: glycosyltransferase, partial [Novosphingobium sp.]